MTDLLPGTEVVARGLRWELVFSYPIGRQTLCRLRGIEGILRGTEVDILSPQEDVHPVQHELRPSAAGSLRNWLVYHQSFLLEQAVGKDTFLSVQPGRLRYESYQLVPVLRAIQLIRPRLLLADSVGLGKTIQAGLVLTELVARRLAHRILVVSPAGPLLEQWKLELSTRFGLRATILNRESIDDITRSHELGSNPFDHVALGLASLDFLKQEKVIEQLERSSFDVVVIDEVHHCADAVGTKEREATQRRRLANVLASRCDALLLLTATPHDGYDRSFASLCELLDPSLVDSRGDLRGTQYRQHVIRRLKSHIKDSRTGEPLFKERIVCPCPVIADTTKHADFINLQRSLLDLIAPELKRAFRSRNFDEVLSFISLLKRSVSTTRACRNTLVAVSDRLRRILDDAIEDQNTRANRVKSLREFQKKVERFGTVSTSEEEEQSLLETEDLAYNLVRIQRELGSNRRKLSRASDVVEALSSLIVLADKAVGADPKIDELLHQISVIRDKEPFASILVYTEYVASKDLVVEKLNCDPRYAGNILEMSGLDDDNCRKSTTAKFCNKEAQILVSTDAASEGLNLHKRCHHLIHLELPFNPNRLEQRNGRIDRYGQKEEPEVKYLFLHGTFEERILMRLIAKYEKQRSRLTFVPNTLGSISTSSGTEKLLKGLMDEDEHLFSDTPVMSSLEELEDNGADEATKELLEEIDRSLKGFEQSAKINSWLVDSGLSADESLMQEAGRASGAGLRLGNVDLVQFVTNAVLLDGGEVIGKLNDKVFRLKLPVAWTHGLEETPGYDSTTRMLWLTTDIDIDRDDHDREIGFIGRAHPVVRIALDRVRSLSYGSDGRRGIDIRVSVVQGEASMPLLLMTYLGRVMSRAGRELERVLAVTVDPNEVMVFYDDPSLWTGVANLERAIDPAGTWDKKFLTWGEGAREKALEHAASQFQGIATEFCEKLLEDRKSDESALQKWLQFRVDEIIGTSVKLPEQLGLLDNVVHSRKQDKEEIADWSQLKDPESRLAGYAIDGTQPSRKRQEAEGVLRIYNQRLNDLKARLDFTKPEVVPLGILMIIPKEQHGA